MYYDIFTLITVHTILASAQCFETWLQHWMKRKISPCFWNQWPAIFRYIKIHNYNWLSNKLGLEGSLNTSYDICFQNLENSDFPDIIPQLRPLMHCVCLVYSRSTFYNSPARIIVIMQETCNMLIEMGRKYIDPASIFQVIKANFVFSTEPTKYGTALNNTQILIFKLGWGWRSTG